MNYLSPWYERFAQSVIWAVIVWTALQLPIVQGSFVGAPDTYGLQSALRLQKNLVAGEAAPVVFVDFGDADWDKAWRRHAPDATAPVGGERLHVPRYALAEVLDFLAATGATAVFVDVDTSYTPSPAEDRALVDAVDRWRARPHAPLLALARTDWTRPSLFERTGVAAPGPNDRVVEGLVSISADDQQIYDNVEYWSCEGPAGAEQPRASVTLYLAAAARLDDGLKGKQAIDAALAKVRCADAKKRRSTLDLLPLKSHLEVAVPGGNMVFPAQIDHGKLKSSGPIHYHMDLQQADDKRWIESRWRSATLRQAPRARCRSDSAQVATLLGVGDILDGIDAGGVSDTLVCGAMVIVGASAKYVRDVHPSPYGDMPGAFILANAARGLDLTGPLRRYPYWPGLGVVIGACLLVFLAHEGIHLWSRGVLTRQPRTRVAKLFRWSVVKITHPLTLSFLITNLLFLVGLVATFFMIRQGYWGVFAASVLAASLSNAFDDVEGMRRVLLKPVDPAP